MKLAATSSSTSARSAMGSRRAIRGDGQPERSLRADNSTRSRCACHSACATGSCPFAAIVSVSAVAGRCGSPETLSTRSSASRRVGTRRRKSGNAAAINRMAEDTDTGGPRCRRHDQPQPDPRESQEQPEDCRDRRKSRPQPLPEQASARPLQSPRQQKPRLVAGPIVRFVQEAAPVRRKSRDDSRYHAQRAGTTRVPRWDVGV